MDVEAVDGMFKVTEGIPWDSIPYGINPKPDAISWEISLIDGMEVNPNIVVLGVIEWMEIVPPPCTNMGVCTLSTLVVDAMLPAVVIEGIDGCKLGLEGIWVGVLTYNKTFGWSRGRGKFGAITDSEISSTSILSSDWKSTRERTGVFLSNSLLVPGLSCELMTPSRASIFDAPTATGWKPLAKSLLRLLGEGSGLVGESPWSLWDRRDGQSATLNYFYKIYLKTQEN